MFLNPALRKSSKRESYQLAAEQLEDRQMLSSVTIYAQGTTGTEQMTLLVDDVEIETWTNVSGNPFTGGVSSFNAEVDGVISPDQIKIRFDNDLYDPANSIDRNLYVDRIQIDLDTYQTESSNVFSTGTWLPQDGVTAGFGRGEVLHSNGYFQFGGATGSGSLIQINASAQDGPANFDLIIDGNVVDSFQAQNSGSSFTYQADHTVAADQIRIQFTNDAYDPANGIDVNLIVEDVVIDGSVFQTDSDSVFSTGTWTSADGVTPGFGRGSTLHSNGYFQFSSDLATERFERLDVIGTTNGMLETDAFSGRYAMVSSNTIEMFNANGSRRANFGNNGIADLAELSGLNPDNDFSVTDSAFFPDGSLLIVGRNFNFSGTSIPYLLKVTPEGTVDTSFAANGFLSGTNLGIASNDSNGSFQAVVDGSGRVTVAGSVWNSRNDLHVRYFDSNGNHDTGRGYGGDVTFYPGYVDTEFESLKLLGDGSMLLAYTGDSGTDFDPTHIVKLGTDGRVDSSYGDNGQAVVTPVSRFYSYRGFEVDNEDRLVMVSRGEIARLSANGNLDSSFGTFGRFGYLDDFTVENGGQRFDFDRDAGVAIDSQNRVVLVSQNVTATGRFSFNYDDSTILRVTEGGNWDTSLNGVGIQSIGFSASNSSFGNEAVAFDQFDNLLLSLGETGPNSDSATGNFRLSRVGIANG